MNCENAGDSREENEGSGNVRNEENERCPNHPGQTCYNTHHSYHLEFWGSLEEIVNEICQARQGWLSDGQSGEQAKWTVGQARKYKFKEKLFGTIFAIMMVECPGLIVAVHGGVWGEDNSLQSENVPKIARATLIRVHEIIISIKKKFFDLKV